MSQVVILVGAQWGDEGKGKWVDCLSEQSDLVCRFQGGDNAGHTIYLNGKKLVLHQLPSAVFHPHTKLLVGANVVVNPLKLLDEIRGISSYADVGPERLWLSQRAHVISPWHIHCDEQREARAKKPIGTTKRGIGPSYEEKMARSGLTLSQYVDDGQRALWFERRSAESSDFLLHTQNHKEAWALFVSAAAELRPFVQPAENQLRKEIASGKRVLLEGAQGTLLDICHGTYPYVTSSSTIAGGALASLGLGPKSVSQVLGVAKAYTTRVGEGPFPSELKDDVGKRIAEKGQERGATTGRPRRCGWFDAVAMRYAVAVNGFDAIYVNKMDILTGFDQIQIVTAYQHPSLGVLDEFPADAEILAACKPVLKSFSGWQKELPKSGSLADCPREAKIYVEAMSELAGVRILAIGTGPERDDFVQVT
ncbi:MAG: adenylosuccinate synthase [Oligoflexales bacterium]|nr:adenylosuccinate synthase [Oligoflexales bacterium]